MLISKGVYSVLMPLMLLSAFALWAEAKHSSIRATRQNDDEDDDDDYADDDDDYADDEGDYDDYGPVIDPNSNPSGSPNGNTNGNPNGNTNNYPNGIPYGYPNGIPNGQYIGNYYGDYNDDYNYYDDRAVLGGNNGDDCADNSTSTSTKKPGISITYGPMCIAFRSLRNVVAMKRLVRITERHYRHNAHFRHAITFLQTAHFIRTARLIEATAAYQTMLARLQASGVDVSELHINRMIDCLFLPVLVLMQQQQQQSQQQQPVPAARSAAALMADGGAVARSLNAYTRDLWHAMPRDKLRTAIGQQLSTNSNFANFYRAIRNTSFQREMLHGLSSKSLKDAARPLRQNYIDLRQLLRFVFRVFSLGPRSSAMPRPSMGLPVKRRNRVKNIITSS